jgi:hypothetical protein
MEGKIATMKDPIALMQEATQTIDQLMQEVDRALKEVDRARRMAIKLEQTMIDLEENEILALARKLDSKEVQSEREEDDLLSGTNKIQLRAQDIIFNELTARRKQDNRDN